MDFSLDLPSGPLAEDILATVRTSSTPSLVNHSLRSFFFAQLLAAHEGLLADTAYDRDLLFAATVLHDLGIGALAKGQARFEVEGADLAAELLRKHGVAERDIDRVWEAIALHASAGLAERRGVLAYLTRGGIGIDFGHRAEIVEHWGKGIHADYPRLNMARSVVDAIVAHAARSAEAGSPYSVGGALLRERRDHVVTSMERAAAASLWRG
ncbi:HD domain-containing protein [Nocardia sp. NPDC052566]|uniref:HD domain-containing protein n=1 Tax=Nocardia sp. NPDC052566 TaxID=3364330 RepID=UPI0037CAEAEF